MKKLLNVLLLSLALPCIAFANVNTAFLKDKRIEDNKTQVLFVMLSKEASMQPTSKPDVFNLTLKGVNSKVIYFSNRPERVSGQLLTNKFMAQWEKGSFKDVPPNAVVEAVKMNTLTNKLQNEESSFAVTLSKPVYSANHKDVSFEVKALPGSPKLQTMKDSDYVAVFIDEVCLSCIGG